MNAFDPAAINIVESKFVKAGDGILAGRTLYLHPLDVLMVQQPSLTPRERVGVLIDRHVQRVLDRIEAAS